MKWSELKRAAEQAGVQDDDEILAIECELHDGSKTLQKVHQGNFVRLIEPISEEKLWETLEHFLKRVLPVAEKAGVKLAMHPDDPPLSPIRGVQWATCLATPCASVLSQMPLRQEKASRPCLPSNHCCPTCPWRRHCPPRTLLHFCFGRHCVASISLSTMARRVIGRQRGSRSVRKQP